MKLEETEAQIQRASLEWLRANHFLCWRNGNQPTPIRKGKYITGFYRSDAFTVGSPDVYVVLPDGRLSGLELKSAKGKVSESQIVWMDRLLDTGADYCLARSVDETIAHYSKFIKK